MTKENGRSDAVMGKESLLGAEGLGEEAGFEQVEKRWGQHPRWKGQHGQRTRGRVMRKVQE